jgi:NADPH:quinone reductase
MKAIVCKSKGDLIIEQIDAPKFTSSTQLVHANVLIKAFGINRADLLQKSGYYPAPAGIPQDILGLEFAGVIESFSDYQEHSGEFTVGDRVMGICSGAAYAEQIIVPRDQLIPIPDAFSFVTAAAIPEAHLTAFDALVNQAQIQSGEDVLIHAIGSGVGSAAAHIAQFLGAKVVGTTRTEWKRQRAEQSLPVEDVWLAKNGRFKSQESEKKFDVILDFVGAAYLKENISCLKSCARLVMIGLLGGAKTDINLGVILAKRAHLIGTVLRSRSTSEKIALTQKYKREILPFLRETTEPNHSADYLVRLEPIQSIYNAKDILHVHQHLEDGLVWSKLVCVWE